MKKYLLSVIDTSNQEVETQQFEQGEFNIKNY